MFAKVESYIIIIVFLDAHTDIPIKCVVYIMDMIKIRCKEFLHLQQTKSLLKYCYCIKYHFYTLEFSGKSVKQIPTFLSDLSPSNQVTIGLKKAIHLLKLFTILKNCI